jgi:hypothetical protein
MQFGHGSADFWHDQPELVGQSIKTRLLLFAGEWFLDTTEGTPWGGFPLNELVVRQGRVLAEQTRLSRDLAIKQRVIQTEGVLGISDYDSTFDPDTRNFSIGMTVDTIYGSSISFTVIPGQTAASASVQFQVVEPQRRPPPPLLTRRR